MTRERAADRIHRRKGCLHHVGTGTPMNMWIDESGSDGKSRSVDDARICRQSDIGTKSHGFNPAVANNDAAWCESFNWTEYGAGVDDQKAITHARNPDAPEPYEGFHHPRRVVFPLPFDCIRAFP